MLTIGVQTGKRGVVRFRAGLGCGIEGAASNYWSSQANRLVGGRAELHECGTGSVVLAAMLAALAVYPVIVHFEVSAIGPFANILMCCLADAFRDTSGASKDSPTRSSVPWLPNRFAYTTPLISPSSPYRIAVSMVFVLLGGVFAAAWEDNHAVQYLYIGATFRSGCRRWSHVLSPAASK